MNKQPPPLRGSAQRPEVDRIDPSEIHDRRCPHCGAPMTKRGCATCAHELARLAAGSRLLDGQSSAPAAMSDASSDEARPQAAAAAPEASAPPTAPKVSYTAAERTRLRQLVAAVGERLPRAAAGATVDAELSAAWASLVDAMALGEEPLTRVCPACGRTGMRAATRCGHCWRPLAAFGS